MINGYDGDFDVDDKVVEIVFERLQAKKDSFMLCGRGGDLVLD